MISLKLCRKVSLGNLFENTFDFIGKARFILLLEIKSNKYGGPDWSRRGKNILKINERQGALISGIYGLFIALEHDFAKSIYKNLAF